MDAKTCPYPNCLVGRHASDPYAEKTPEELLALVAKAEHELKKRELQRERKQLENKILELDATLKVLNTEEPQRLAGLALPEEDQKKIIQDIRDQIGFTGRTRLENIPSILSVPDNVRFTFNINGKATPYWFREKYRDKLEADC